MTEFMQICEKIENVLGRIHKTYCCLVPNENVRGAIFFIFLIVAVAITAGE